MKHAIAVWSISVLLMYHSASSSAAGAQPPDATTARALGLVDDFEIDSRRRYRLEGPVQWIPGRLVFGEGASIGQAVQFGSQLKLRLRLDWEPLDPGRSSETRVVIAVRDAGQVTIAFTRTMTATPRSQINLSFPAKDQDVVDQDDSSRVAPLPTDFKGECTVSYRHGLLEVVADENTIAIGYMESDTKPVTGWSVQQTVGEEKLERLLLEGSAAPRELTPREQTELTRADEFLEATAAAETRRETREVLQNVREAVRIRKSLLGAQHPDYAEALSDLAVPYARIGKNDAAKMLYEESRQIQKEVLGTKHPAYARTLRNLSWLYMNIGEYAEVEPLLLEARTVVFEVFGQDHRSSAMTLDQLGELYVRMGAYEKAEPMFQQAQRIYQKLSRQPDHDYMVSLGRLAGLYFSLGKYWIAEPLFIEARDISLELRGRNSMIYATCLNGLGALYLKVGDYGKAETFFKESLEITRILEERLSPDYATSLNNLSSVYTALGDYSRAEPLQIEALAIRKQTLGEEHPRYATSLNNLALLYKSTGENAKALVLIKQALEIRKNVLGEEHPHYLSSLNILASLYFSMGEFAKAEMLMVENREVRKRILGPDHPLNSITLQNLATLYITIGEYARAKPLCIEAARVTKAALGEQHPDNASCLILLALLHRSTGADDKAESLFRQALHVLKPAIDKNYPRYAQILFGLAGIHVRRGRFSQAEELYREALDTYQPASAKNDPLYARMLLNLAGMQSESGKYEEAGRLAEEALSLLIEAAKNTLPAVSEAEALSWLHSNRPRLDLMFTTAAHLKEEQSAGSLQREQTRRLYHTAWQTRALATRMQAGRRLGPDASPKAKETLSKLLTTRRFLSQLTLAVQPPGQRAQFAAAITKLNRDKEEFERDLAVESSQAARFLAIRDVGVDQFATTLPADVAIVDIYESQRLSFRPQEQAATEQTAKSTDASQQHNYVLIEEREYDAFVLTRGSATEPIRPRTADTTSSSQPEGTPAYEIAWVPLGSADEIDEQIVAWRRQLLQERGRGLGLRPQKLRTPDPASSQQLAATARQTLRKRIWEKIEPHFGDRQTVIVIPDAKLASVPWSALPGKTADSFLLEEYAIATAPFGQQIYGWLSQQQLDVGGLVIAGDIDYQRSPLSQESGVDASSNTNTFAQSGTSFRRAVSKDENLVWDRLPGTGVETERIVSTFREHFGVDAVEFRARQAGELEVAGAMEQARYVHLATHGFFAGADSDSAKVFDQDPRDRQLFGANIAADWLGATVAARNPLLLSGLALSGANLGPLQDELGTESGQDGILSAEEVAGLNLAGTELVVLSACETGLGETAEGEGVFGLQRAFAQAGSRTTVASLWRVDDDATQTLMVEFYRNLWQRKLHKLEALRQAQLTMIRRYNPRTGRLDGSQSRDDRQRSKSKREPLPPYYWAAFTFSGDWR